MAQTHDELLFYMQILTYSMLLLTFLLKAPKIFIQFRSVKSFWKLKDWQLQIMFVYKILFVKFLGQWEISFWNSRGYDI